MLFCLIGRFVAGAEVGSNSLLALEIDVAQVLTKILVGVHIESQRMRFSSAESFFGETI